MARTTKTLNPLPFGDLEPHRFEDLVRQLAYDFRRWRSLEAIGRSGADEGVDIRGVEAPLIDQPPEEPDEGTEEYTSGAEAEPPSGERVWVFQCKREKSIGQAKVKSIVADFFDTNPDTPYGYILAAACDFSKAARDSLRDALRSHGVSEVYSWGKGELEDQLFQPKNDHLLFAYFGLSIQVRRASAKSLVRSRLSLKRKLVKELGAIDQVGDAVLLIRDPSDGRYPHVANPPQFANSPAWRFWQFHSHDPLDHLTFVTLKFFAYVNYETGEWDWMRGLDISTSGAPDLSGVTPDQLCSREKESIYRAYWQLHVPAQHRAWLMELRPIPYDRILAYDEIGDFFNQGPHLLVEYRDGEPFEPSFSSVLRSADSFGGWELYPTGPDDPKHVEFFPKEVPDEREQWKAELHRRTKPLDRQGD